MYAAITPPRPQTQLLTTILSNVPSLATHPYGNYVVQHLLSKRYRQQSIASLGIDINHVRAGLVPQSHRNLSLSGLLAHLIRGNAVRLARHKYSSNVVEKCIVWASHDRRLITDELFQSELLPQLLQDSYANYVIQTALQSADKADVHDLIAAVKPHLAVFNERSTPTAVFVKWNLLLTRLASPEAEPFDRSMYEPKGMPNNSGNKRKQKPSQGRLGSPGQMGHGASLTGSHSAGGRDARRGNASRGKKANSMRASAAISARHVGASASRASPTPAAGSPSAYSLHDTASAFTVAEVRDFTTPGSSHARSQPTRSPAATQAMPATPPHITLWPFQGSTGQQQRGGHQNYGGVPPMPGMIPVNPSSPTFAVGSYGQGAMLLYPTNMRINDEAGRPMTLHPTTAGGAVLTAIPGQHVTMAHSQPGVAVGHVYHSPYAFHTPATRAGQTVHAVSAPAPELSAPAAVPTTQPQWWQLDPDVATVSAPAHQMEMPSPEPVQSVSRHGTRAQSSSGDWTASFGSSVVSGSFGMHAHPSSGTLGSGGFFGDSIHHDMFDPSA